MGLSLDLGFGGRGFEPRSWFLGDVDLIPHLSFWGTWV